MIRHAGLVALRLGGYWRGVLIEGPSGSGKSDLALQCLAEGFQLVSDDRTLVWTSGGRLYGRAPDSLRGLLEVRGLGVLPTDSLDFAEISLVVSCANSPAEVDRMPDQVDVQVLDAKLPLRRLWPFEPSAPVKLRRALDHLGLRP